MALKYVINAMKKRKLRTFIVAIALIVGVALVGALLALVDTQRQYALQQVGDQTGGYDLGIRRNDLALTPFFDPAPAEQNARAVNAETAAIYPRIQGSALARTNLSLQDWSVTVVGLDVDKDGLNRVKPILEGSFPPGPGQVFLTSFAADLLQVKAGDEIQLSYLVPVPRESGKASATSGSSARADGRFIVAGVGIVSGFSDASNVVLMRLSDAQAWLNQPGRVERLLVVWNSDRRAGSDAKLAVTLARDAGERVKDQLQARLGPDYTVILPKYNQLENQAQAFIFQQSFISIYGLLSMGIIGLMVNALMMTTVQEQKRDLAVLRVLGAPRHKLYETVVLEVALLGAIGVIFGVVAGRLLNDFVISPILLRNLDLPAGVRPEWTLQSVLTPTLITAAVLAIATIAPAREAGATKVMVVLNPAAADQPTLEDLAKLRERRTDWNLLILGGILLLISFIIFFLFPLLFGFGDQNLFATVFFGALMLMVIGMSLVFYFVTTPLERVLLFLYRLVSRRASYFTTRYTLRGKGRNALISMMVVASAVLPCLLAAQLVLTDANLDTDIRFSTGADVTASYGGAGFGGGGFGFFRARIDQRFGDGNLAEFQTHPGVQSAVAISNDYGSEISDRVQLRTRRVRFTGVTGDMNDVLYREFFSWTQGDSSALTRITRDDYAVIISTAMQDSLDVQVGEVIRVKGAGLDHERNMVVAGIASRIPGFSSDFTSNRNSATAGSTGIMMSMRAYRDLRNDPSRGVPDLSEDIYTRVFVRKLPQVNDNSLGKALRDTFSRQKGINIQVTTELIDQIKTALQQGRVFTLVLTALSMVTAVFGVLAVMYTAVMGRRIEIGMLKAIGSSGSTLRGVFIGEAVVTTLSAAIAGIVAGTILGILFVVVQRFNSENPTLWAFDAPTALVICAMVVVAALFSAWLATQPVLRQKAIFILRER